MGLQGSLGSEGGAAAATVSLGGLLSKFRLKFRLGAEELGVLLDLLIVQVALVHAPVGEVARVGGLALGFQEVSVVVDVGVGAGLRQAPSVVLSFGFRCHRNPVPRT